MTVKWHPGVDLSTYLDGELGPEEQRVVASHLEACERCRDELRDLSGVRHTVRGLPRLALERPLRPAVGVHPDESLTAYLDGELPFEERVGIDNHLAACAGCAAELASLQATRSSLRELPWLDAPPLEAIVPPELSLSRHRPQPSRPAPPTAPSRAPSQAPVVPIGRRRRPRRSSLVLTGVAAAIALLGFLGAGFPTTSEPRVRADLTAFATNHASFAPSGDGVSGAATALAFAQQP